MDIDIMWHSTITLRKVLWGLMGICLVQFSFGGYNTNKCYLRRIVWGCIYIYINFRVTLWGFWCVWGCVCEWVASIAVRKHGFAWSLSWLFCWTFVISTGHLIPQLKDCFCFIMHVISYAVEVHRFLLLLIKIKKSCVSLQFLNSY